MSSPAAAICSSQMLMMSKLLDKAYIKELELIVHEPEDMKKVLNFMMSDANKAG